MPQGTMPVLEIDGKKASQSLSIARYLAREFNLYGKTNEDMLVVDQIVDTSIDLFEAFIKVVFNKDEKEKEIKMKEFYETTLPKQLGFLEALAKDGKGFAVGQSLTLADLALFTYIENCRAGDKLEKFPVLAANRQKVEQLPKIKEYLASRPKTEF